VLFQSDPTKLRKRKGTVNKIFKQKKKERLITYLNRKKKQRTNHLYLKETNSDFKWLFQPDYTKKKGKRNS
jgi:hypothetical protein